MRATRTITVSYILKDYNSRLVCPFGSPTMISLNRDMLAHPNEATQRGVCFYQSLNGPDQQYEGTHPERMAECWGAMVAVTSRFRVGHES